MARPCAPEEVRRARIAESKKKYYSRVGGVVKQLLRNRYKYDIEYQWRKQSESLENYYWDKQHPCETQFKVFCRINVK